MSEQNRLPFRSEGDVTCDSEFSSCTYQYACTGTVVQQSMSSSLTIYDIETRSTNYQLCESIHVLQIFSNESEPKAKTGFIPSPQLSGTLSRPDSNRFRIIIGRNHHDVLGEFHLSTSPMEEEGMPRNHPSPELQFPNCAKEPLVLVRSTFPIDSMQIARRDCSRAIPGARRN